MLNVQLSRYINTSRTLTARSQPTNQSGCSVVGPVTIVGRNVRSPIEVSVNVSNIPIQMTGGAQTPG